MQRTDLSAAQHSQMADLMQSLAAMQFKMSRVKSMFPQYHQQLQNSYNQLLIHAKRSNMLPPWMTA